MAEPDGIRRSLRAAALAAVFVAQVSAVAAKAHFHRAGLAREAWTSAVMMAGWAGLPPAGPPDVAGLVELYGDGRIMVLTAVGLQEVRLDADTVIARAAGPGAMTDVRPGKLAVVWGRRSLLGDHVQARAILVGGY